MGRGEEEEEVMGITLPDARELSDEVLQALRMRALQGCALGMKHGEVARMLGVARETVSRWWSAYKSNGLEGLPDDRTGRPVGSGRTLTDEQGRHIQQLIDEHSPEDLAIAAPLWSRRAVRDLIKKEYGISMAVRTVGQYLKRWGYTAKRPQRHARDQDPEEVREWLEETYPEIERRARAEEVEAPQASAAVVQPAESEVQSPPQDAGPSEDRVAVPQPEDTTAEATPQDAEPSDESPAVPQPEKTEVQATPQDAEPSAGSVAVPQPTDTTAQVPPRDAEPSDGSHAVPQPPDTTTAAKQQDAEPSDDSPAVPQAEKTTAQARAKKGEILFGDETGVAADEHPRYGYARKGQRATMPVPDPHIRVNVLSTVSNEGTLRFMTYKGGLNAKRFIEFLRRLLRTTTRKIYLIVDQLRAHKAAAVKKWLSSRTDKIELHLAPRRSPELNPDEYLNNDLKGNVHAAGLPHNENELRSRVLAFLRKLYHTPGRIMSYFQHPCAQYAAGS